MAIQCITDGCGKKHYAKGMCNKCYTRLRRKGCCNPEKQYVIGEGRKKNPLYDTYNNIKQKCYNINNTNYKYNGGRGVVMCDRWLGPEGFTNFCNDVGKRPEGCQLYMINGIYSPDNCARGKICLY